MQQMQLSSQSDTISITFQMSYWNQTITVFVLQEQEPVKQCYYVPMCTAKWRIASLEEGGLMNLGTISLFAQIDLDTQINIW